MPLITKRLRTSRTCIHRFTEYYKNPKKNYEVETDVLCMNEKARWYGLTIYINKPVLTPKNKYPRAKSRCYNCTLKEFSLKPIESSRLEKWIKK